MRSLRTVSLLSLLLVLSLKAQEIAPQAPAANLPVQRIGAEDLLGISVYEAPDWTRTVRVAADGFIRLPLVHEKIQAAGMYPTDIEASIAGALRREKMFNDPSVTVTVAEYHSRAIGVMGAVKRPVVFQAIGTVTLLDALARAEGLSAEAGGEIVITAVSRPVQHVPVRALLDGSDAALNIQLSGGEEVRIPEAGKVVVWGNVKRSGVFPVQENGSSTIMTVLAQAEGVTAFFARTAFIYRPRATGTKEEIAVDLKRILERKAPDVALLPRDILYIPDNSGRRMTAAALDRLAGFGSSTASGLLIWKH